MAAEQRKTARGERLASSQFLEQTCGLAVSGSYSQVSSLSTQIIAQSFLYKEYTFCPTFDLPLYFRIKT